MPLKREEARLIRLNKIKARKAAKLEGVANGDPVENAGICDATSVVVATEVEVPANKPESAVLAIISNPPDEPKPAAPTGPRQARIYAKPLNVRMRLIEFMDDKSHGKLWVKMDAPPMLNWLVFVRPDDSGRDWVLHGKYNARGIRLL